MRIKIPEDILEGIVEKGIQDGVLEDLAGQIGIAKERRRLEKKFREKGMSEKEIRELLAD